MSEVDRAELWAKLDRLSVSQLLRLADENGFAMKRSLRAGRRARYGRAGPPCRKAEIIDVICEEVSGWDLARAAAILKEVGIEVPEGEPEVNGEDAPEEPEGTEESEEATAQPDYVIEHEKKTQRLKDLVADCAVEKAEKEAEAKAAKKQFEQATENLIEHLNTVPEPEHQPQLPFDEGEQAEQADGDAEPLEPCPDCQGAGHDGQGSQCEACEGTGTIPAAQPEGSEEEAA